MRLLLLLSAVLTALTGVVVGPAAGAQRVEASASAVESAQAGVAAHAAIAGPAGDALPVLRTIGWHAAPAPALIDARPLYADRRRE